MVSIGAAKSAPLGGWFAYLTWFLKMVVNIVVTATLS